MDQRVHPSIDTPPSQPAGYEIILPEALTIETVGAFIEQFRPSGLSEGMIVHMDAAHTETITTPGIQALTILATAVEQAGSVFRLSNPSETLEYRFRALGLDKLLEQWSNHHG